MVAERETLAQGVESPTVVGKAGNLRSSAYRTFHKWIVRCFKFSGSDYSFETLWNAGFEASSQWLYKEPEARAVGAAKARGRKRRRRYISILSAVAATAW